MNKPKVMDSRSLRGIFSRGKTVYQGGSPNPSGYNGARFQKAAIAKLRKKGQKLV